MYTEKTNALMENLRTYQLLKPVAAMKWLPLNSIRIGRLTVLNRIETLHILIDKALSC